MRSTAPASLALLLTACATATLGHTLGDDSYAELRPASKLLVPGTIVIVRRADPFIAGIICTSDASLGAGFQPPVSPTVSRELKQKVEANFGLDASYLNALKAQAKYSSLKNVSLVISNSQVLEISDALVRANVKNRSDDCKKSIVGRRARRETITMITSVVQADVKYQVDFNENGSLSVAEKDALVKDLAAEFDVSAGASGSNSMSGAGLFWGSRDDQYMVSIGSDPNTLLFRVLIDESAAPVRTQRLQALHGPVVIEVLAKED
jgi:hypothetical protein